MYNDNRINKDIYPERFILLIDIDPKNVPEAFTRLSLYPDKIHQKKGWLDQQLLETTSELGVSRSIIYPDRGWIMGDRARELGYHPHQRVSTEPLSGLLKKLDVREERDMEFVKKGYSGSAQGVVLNYMLLPPYRQTEPVSFAAIKIDPSIIGSIPPDSISKPIIDYYLESPLGVQVNTTFLMRPSPFLKRDLKTYLYDRATELVPDKIYLFPDEEKTKQRCERACIKAVDMLGEIPHKLFEKEFYDRMVDIHKETLSYSNRASLMKIPFLDVYMKAHAYMEKNFQEAVQKASQGIYKKDQYWSLPQAARNDKTNFEMVSNAPMSFYKLTQEELTPEICLLARKKLPAPMQHDRVLHLPPHIEYGENICSFDRELGRKTTRSFTYEQVEALYSGKAIPIKVKQPEGKDIIKMFRWDKEKKEVIVSAATLKKGKTIPVKKEKTRIFKL